jgi:hypothetical protein
MYCEKCGNKTNESANFCRECGNQLNAKNIKPSAESPKKFNWGITYIKVSFILTLVFFILSGSLFGYKEEIALSLFTALFFGLPIGVVITIIIKNSKKRLPKSNKKNLTPEEINKYKGLSGWLTLVIIGLFVSAGRLGYEFISIFKGEIAYTGMTGWFFYDFITMGSLTALAIYLIYLFFKKNKKFPEFYIIFLISWALVNVATLLFVSFGSFGQGSIDEYLENVFRAVFMAIVWGLYMTKSKRVKATFIES